MTALDIIKNALYELNVLAVGETPSNDDANFCLSKLNRIFDNWNAENLSIFGTFFFQGTLTPGHNPHTIGIAGSGADFIVPTARPSRIDLANLVLTDVSPVIYREMKIVDETWWMANPVPDLATQIPFYLYPNFGWPLGQLYLWPVPTKAYDLRLNLWSLFSSLSLTGTFSMPPGYEDAVTLTLAESVAPAFGAVISPALEDAANKARVRIRSMNSESPEMSCDPALQSMDSRPSASIANMLSGFLR